MKKLFSILVFMIPALLFSQTCVPAGPVEGTWDLEGSPYYIYGNIYVGSHAKLVIEPGVNVVFRGWYDFAVYGTLSAVGTEAQMIRFTTINIPHVKWRGMIFKNTDRYSDLSYCIFEAGEKPLDDKTYNSGGVLSVINAHKARITFKNCIFRDNEAYYGGAIHVSDAIPRFYDCEIINNNAIVGGGINLSDGANITMKGTKVAENTALLGAGINIYNSQPSLYNNTIEYNSASDYGGGLRIVTATGFTIKYNDIVNNSAYKGGGLCINNSDGFFCSNTIAQNEAMLKGGGIYVYGISHSQFMNCIFYYNKSYMVIDGEQVYLQSDGSDPDFQYCNIEGGLVGFAGPGTQNFYGFYSQNIKEDPMFENASAGNFNITWKNYPFDDDTKSPCIDAGCPNLAGDPDCSCCDIGSHYYFQVLEKPTDLLPFIGPELSFIATWSSSYGALGYYLDVAKDPGFHKFVVKDHIVTDTSCLVSVYVPYTYYCRVRSFNTGITSDYSDAVAVTIAQTETTKLSELAVIRSTPGKVYIDLGDKLSSAGELKVFNLAGQLIADQAVSSGSNVLEFSCSEQIVLVNLIMDGQVYQDKIYIH
jgi:hypothetical protein